MNDDIEQSFFKLAEFQMYKNIYHNLNNWNITIDSWENKAGQIEIYVSVPYSEMILEINEINKDINFFDKHTARLKISINKSNQNYLFNEKVKCTFSENVKYLLIDSMYIYPHNWYYIYNREYLRNKIIFSIEYINEFLESYKSTFNSNVPYIYIKRIKETATEYEFEIIIKEYLDIFYVSTDADNVINYLNLLCDSNVNKDKPIKYKKINLKIPRFIKDKKNYFKFVPGNWKK
jgi:hypothetical protein